MGELIQIEIDRLIASPTQPRQTFDKKSMEELTASVKENNIIEPILVREWSAEYELPKKLKLSGPYYEIINGERRYRAAKSLGMLTVPCLLSVMDTRKVIETQMIGFVHRADLHPLEEAHAFSVALEKGGYSSKEIAAKIGKSASYVEQRIVLLNLIGPMQQYFLSGHMNAYQAMQIARCTPAFQEEIQKRFEHFLEGSYTLETRDLVDFIDANSHRSMKKAPFNVDDAGLVPECGACTLCPKRTTNRPDLFEGVSSDDTCTDGKCFEAKVQAHLKQVKEKLQEKEGTVVTISTNFQKVPKGTLTPQDYRVATKSEKGAVRALVVSGDEVGKTKYVVPKSAEQPPEKKEKAPKISPIEKQMREEHEKLRWIELRQALYEKAEKNGLTEDMKHRIAEAFGDWMSEPDLEEYGLKRETISGDQHLIVVLIESTTAGGFGDDDRMFWKKQVGFDGTAFLKQKEKQFEKDIKEALKAEQKKAKEEPAKDAPPAKIAGKARNSKMKKESAALDVEDEG